MRQLQILFSKPKLDTRLFVDLAEFTCSYQFLHELLIKLFFWSAEQFNEQLLQELSSFGFENKIWSSLIFIKLYLAT